MKGRVAAAGSMFAALVALVCLLALVVSLDRAPTASAAGANLLVNGDFSSGITGWNPYCHTWGAYGGGPITPCSPYTLSPQGLVLTGGYPYSGVTQTVAASANTVLSGTVTVGTMENCNTDGAVNVWVTLLDGNRQAVGTIGFLHHPYLNGCTPYVPANTPTSYYRDMPSWYGGTGAQTFSMDIGLIVTQYMTGVNAAQVAFLTLTLEDYADMTTPVVTFSNLMLVEKGQTSTNPAPVLSALSPTSATVEGPSFTLTADGSGFVAGSALQWNSAPLTTAVVSATQLTGIVPAASISATGTASVTVSNPAPGGGTSNVLTFTVSPTLPGAPGNVTATAGNGLATVHWTAPAFDGGSSITGYSVTAYPAQSTTPVTTTSVGAGITGTTVTGLANGSAYVFTVAARNAAGTGPASLPSSVVTPTVPPNPAPTLAVIFPTSAPAGGPAFTLVVTGTDFIADATVQWNGAPLTTTFVSASQLTATVPAATVVTTGTASITVMNPAPGGGTSPAKPFAVVEDQLDQWQAAASSFYIAASARQLAAQSFAAGLSGALDRVSLYLSLRPSNPGEATGPGDLIVQIQTVDASGTPTGNVLGSGIVPGGTFSAWSARWVDVLLTQPARLSGGTAYAIVLSSVSGNGSYDWRIASTPAAYLPGGALSRDQNGVWHHDEQYYDYAFKTYVVATDKTRVPALSAKQARVTDAAGNAKSSFNPGDKPTYGGLIHSALATAGATFRWSVEGPCGSVAWWSSDTGGAQAVPAGDGWLSWSSSIPENACLGSYTFRVTASYDGSTTTASATFSVALPPYPIVKRVWTTDAAGNAKTQFQQGDAIRILGEVSTPGSTGLSLSWSLDGRCGSITPSSTVITPTAGVYTYTTTVGIPADSCPGFYVAWFRVGYEGYTIGKLAQVFIDQAPVDVVADKIEVTQAVQDLANSIRLVANKRTFVRFHVHASGGTPKTTAWLAVRRGTTMTILRPVNDGGKIAVRPSPDRGSLNDAFLFELPDGYKEGTVTLTGVANPGYSWGTFPDPQETDYSNNEVSATVSFESVPAVKLALYRVGYGPAASATYPAVTHTTMLVDWIKRAYPLSDLQVWYDSFWVKGSLPTCDEVNAQLEYKRSYADVSKSTAPPADAHFYGMVDDRGGFMRGCASGIPSSTASGPTGVPGRGFWDTDGSYGDWYGGHELGHTWGRKHTRGGPRAGAGGCGDEVGPDTGFPASHTNGRISGALTGDSAVYGFDVGTKAVYGPTWSDLMSYCQNQWISDYSYQNMMNALQGKALLVAATRQTISQTDRILVVGTINLSTTQVTLQPIVIIPNAGDLKPRTPGSYAIVLRDAGGAELARYAFTPAEMDTDVEEGAHRMLLISELVPYAAGTARVEIEGPGGVLKSIGSGAQSPTVSLLSPNGGETLSSDAVAVTWAASDPDGDSLTFNVQYSGDDGATWNLVAQNITGTSVTLDTRNLAGTAQGRFRVWASDGIHSTTDDSDATFTVASRPPSVSITSPSSAATVAVSQTVRFEGSAVRSGAGPVADSQLQWVSSLDGVLGTGAQLSVARLRAGNHLITFRAEDAVSGIVSATVQLIVVGDTTELAVPADALQVGPSLITLDPAQGASTAQLSVNNVNATNPITWSAVASQPWVQLSKTAGTTPDATTVSANSTGMASGTYSATITLTSPAAPGEVAISRVELAVPSSYRASLPVVMHTVAGGW